MFPIITHEPLDLTDLSHVKQVDFNWENLFSREIWVSKLVYSIFLNIVCAGMMIIQPWFSSSEGSVILQSLKQVSLYLVGRQARPILTDAFRHIQYSGFNKYFTGIIPWLDLMKRELAELELLLLSVLVEEKWFMQVHVLRIIC